MGKRLITQRRGSGTSRYRSPSHRHIQKIKHPVQGGKIIKLIHAPGRKSPVAVLDSNEYIICPLGVDIGTKIEICRSSVSLPEKKAGNVFYLKDLKIGDKIYNIESSSSDGGKFARGAGASAVVAKEGEKKVLIKFPSGTIKYFDGNCRAAIGKVAASGISELYVCRAGRKRHYLRSRAKMPMKVSGIAMNPVDHPHGGGNHPHVGRRSSVGRNTSPGAKVGNLAPQRKKKIKK